MNVEIPKVPYYINAGNIKLEVSDFSIEELKELGQEWINKLISVRANQIAKKKTITH